MLTRRHWMAATAGAVLPALALGAARAPASAFAAAWETPGGAWRIGLLADRGAELVPHASLEVPTRAHGLLWFERYLLAVARRPGDWLVRWSPGAEPQWGWIEPDRAFNGHVIASRDRRHLYTTETDLETGAGLVGVRDAATLEKQAEWATGGMDPHELVLHRDGSLLVANGGIPTLPETGRLKLGLDRMDASLVHLDPRSGALRGQWRLADRRLSLRHLAWGERDGRDVLGIALQAEHDEPERREAAPVLALFDGRALQALPAPRPLRGYGGDIAFAGGRFAVSCPRADGIALHAADGRWLGFAPLREGCSLASAGRGIWAGGSESGRLLSEAEGATGADARAPRLPGLRLDNHWLALPA